MVTSSTLIREAPPIRTGSIEARPAAGAISYIDLADAQLAGYQQKLDDLQTADYLKYKKTTLSDATLATLAAAATAESDASQEVIRTPLKVGTQPEIDPAESTAAANGGIEIVAPGGFTATVYTAAFLTSLPGDSPECAEVNAHARTVLKEQRSLG